jgi:hypothetical protein
LLLDNFAFWAYNKHILTQKERTMELNTKQVRAIVNKIAGFGAQYTDATSEHNEARRSVVYCFKRNTDADNAYNEAVATFKTLGVTNKVTRTTHSWRGEYLRIIANIA